MEFRSKRTFKLSYNLNGKAVSATSKSTCVRGVTRQLKRKMGADWKAVKDLKVTR